MRGAVCMSASLVAAALWAANARADSAPHTHDGFYLRLSLGGGRLDAMYKGSDTTPDAYGGGGAVMLDILAGGTPAPGLVVGGGYQFGMAQHVDFNQGTSYTGSGGNVARGVIGPFVEWYPDPHGGFSAGLMVGPSVLLLQMPTIRILGVQFGNNIDTLGIGGNLWAGYTFWVASEWSLGLEARGGLSATKNNDDSSQTGSATSWALLVTGVYH